MLEGKIDTPIEVEIREKAERIIGLLVQVVNTSGVTGKEALRQCLNESLNIAKAKYKPFLTIDFKDCGGSAVYETWEDVPEVDVPCPCGNPNHWLIKYEAIEEDGYSHNKSLYGFDA